MVAVCIVYDNTWEFLMTFWWHIWCLLATKNSFPSWRLFSSRAILWFVIGGFPPLLFSLFPSKFVLTIQNFIAVLLVIDISISVFIFLILIFCYWSFFKKIYLFSILSFNPNLWYIYIFNLILIILIFWVFLLNRFFFSISPFNKKFIVFL